MKEKIIELINNYGYVILGSLLYALLIVIIGILISKISPVFLNKLFEKSRLNNKKLLKNLILKFVKATIYILTIILALEKLGISIAPFIAGLGITGLVLGFGFRDTLSNFAAGMLLIIYEPFNSDDAVDIGGTAGKIIDISLVNTHIIAFDGLDIYLPNSSVWGSKITNFSRCKYRRKIFEISVDYNTNLTKVVETLQDIIKNDNRILEEPGPFIRVEELQDSGILIKAGVYVLPEHFGNILNDFYKIVKERFDNDNINIPFPQLDVNIKNS